MSRIDELIKEKCPKGVKRFIIGDICKVTRGRVISKQELRENEGEYPVYSSQTLNNGIFGKINTFDFDGEYVQWTTDGANAGSIFYRNGKFSVTNVCGLLKVKSEYKEKIRTDYLAYSLGKESKKFVNYATSNPKLMSNVMSKISVLIPPIEVQEEIVRILDKFSELEAELEARKKQYEFCINNVFNNLGNLMQIKSVLEDKGYIRGPFGSSLVKKDMVSSGVPVYEQQHAIYNHRNFRYFISQEKAKKLNRFMVKTGDLIISCSGTVGKISIIKNSDTKGVINQALLILRLNDKIVLPKYVKYFLESPNGYKNIISNTNKSAQVNISNREAIEKIMIPVPSIQKQEEIIKKLDNFDKLINDISEGLPAEIETRRKQYEYYRNKLLSFEV